MRVCSGEFLPRKVLLASDGTYHLSGGRVLFKASGKLLSVGPRGVEQSACASGLIVASVCVGKRGAGSACRSVPVILARGRGSFDVYCTALSVGFPGGVRCACQLGKFSG